MNNIESLKKKYLELKPPIRDIAPYLHNPTRITCFSDYEKQLIDNSEYPEDIQMLEENKRRSEAASRRHQILHQILCYSNSDIDIAWVNTMLLNEVFAFIKSYLIRYATNNELYNALFTECFTEIISSFPNFGEKLQYYTLTTLISLPMKHAISKYLSQQNYNTSSNHAANAYKVSQAMSALEQQGIEPTVKNITSLTGLSEKIVRTAIDTIHASNRTDLDNETVLSIASEQKNPEETFLAESLKENLRSNMDKLTRFERACIIMRYDLNNNYGKNIPIGKIAKDLNTTSHYVNKALKQAIETLRINLS